MYSCTVQETAFTFFSDYAGSNGPQKYGCVNGWQSLRFPLHIKEMTDFGFCLDQNKVAVVTSWP